MSAGSLILIGRGQSHHFARNVVDEHPDDVKCPITPTQIVTSLDL